MYALVVDGSNHVCSVFFLSAVEEAVSVKGHFPDNVDVFLLYLLSFLLCDFSAHSENGLCPVDVRLFVSPRCWYVVDEVEVE